MRYRNPLLEAVASVGQVPRDLRHPGLVRLTRDAGDLHGAGLEFHDEEDDVADQTAQGQHLDGEEVGCREGVPMQVGGELGISEITVKAHETRSCAR